MPAFIPLRWKADAPAIAVSLIKHGVPFHVRPPSRTFTIQQEDLNSGIKALALDGLTLHNSYCRCGNCGKE
jgi:hypothetical protein